MGYAYGDFDAHDGLWHMCQKTANDVLARMALVPRTLEARGLDATPLIQTKLRKAATPAALPSGRAAGHHPARRGPATWPSAITGTAVKRARGLDPVSLYGELVQRYEAAEAATAI